MRLHLSTTWAAAALLLTFAAPRPAAQAPASPAAPPVFDTTTKQRIRVVTVASGLVHPWSLAFLPDGKSMLVAERSGQLRVVRDGVLAPQALWTATGSTGDDRLHAVAVHPQFATNQYVYVSYPKTGPKGNTLAVARGTLRRGARCRR